MDFTSLLNMLPVAVRLEPVIAKYGKGALALYKADEAQALQLFGDIAGAAAAPNPVTIVGLVVKWGPILAKFVETEAPIVQQFLADVKAAMGTTAIPSITAPALPNLPPNLAAILASLPIPISLPPISLPTAAAPPVTFP